MAKLRTWWRQIKQHRVANVVVGIVLVVVVALIIAVVWSNGTGFNGYNQVTTARTISGPSAGTVVRTEVYQPGKSLWDWLQLLFIPIVLGGVGSWLGRRQSKIQEKATTEQQYKDALQTFWDNMSKLILEKDKDLLHAPKGTSVREIARTQTLVTLSRLRGSHGHKAALLLFLHEANLIKNPDPIISLSPTMEGERSQSVSKIIVAHWNEALLKEADLHDACLRQIDLRDAILSNAILSGADLVLLR
jgi:hypothetical protein